MILKLKKPKREASKPHGGEAVASKVTAAPQAPPKTAPPKDSVVATPRKPGGDDGAVSKAKSPRVPPKVPPAVNGDVGTSSKPSGDDAAVSNAEVPEVAAAVNNAVFKEPETHRLRTRLTRKEAAAYLTSQGFPITPGRLAKFAAKGGPPYVVWLKKVLYERQALLAWAEACEKKVIPKGGPSQTQ
jgi:hypothetical protein